MKTAILTNPCAVMEYFEWFKMDREVEGKKQEIILLDVEANHLTFLELRDSELIFFRENMGGFELVEDTPDGRVWEQGSFRAIVKQLKPTR